MRASPASAPPNANSRTNRTRNERASRREMAGAKLHTRDHRHPKSLPRKTLRVSRSLSAVQSARQVGDDLVAIHLGTDRRLESVDLRPHILDAVERRDRFIGPNLALNQDGLGGSEASLRQTQETARRHEDCAGCSAPSGCWEMLPWLKLWVRCRSCLFETRPRILIGPHTSNDASASSIGNRASAVSSPKSSSPAVVSSCGGCSGSRPSISPSMPDVTGTSS